MNIFTKAKQRYKIDSFEFTRMRENLHISVEDFAAIVGWSASYQYQLEEGKFITISEKTMNEIRSAFRRCGMDVALKD